MKTFSLTLALGSALGLASLVACSSSQPAPVDQPVTTAEATSAPDMPAEPPATATAEPTAAATAEPPPPAKKAWKDMDFEEKKKFMAEEVTPKMGKMMTEFDAKEFPKVECGTCHSDLKTFKMPNTKILKLDPKDGFKKHMAKHGKMVEFMMQKVTPEMTALLGHSPFDPATGQGFGCGGCHVMVK